MTVFATSEYGAASVDAADGLELLESASRQLQKVVPFDGAAWFATDPGTVLATCPARLENIETGHCDTYWQREFLVEDTLLFRDLAKASVPGGTLAMATDENPRRSARYREFLEPQGYRDELRAVFRAGDANWGFVDLFRDKHRPAFTQAELDTVLELAPKVATALRALSLSSPESAPASGSGDGPGTALYRGTALWTHDEQAERWFTELAGPDWCLDEPPILMATVVSLLARARAIAEGRERGQATARMRSLTGRWMTAHASCLPTSAGDPALTSIVIQPAKSAQIAPIIVQAYCLTGREQEITRAVARGLTNVEIAAELHLSAHTVRDHLKAVFAKVGVGTRGELVAKLFADHYAPAMHSEGAPITHVEY